MNMVLPKVVLDVTPISIPGLLIRKQECVIAAVCVRQQDAGRGTHSLLYSIV